MYGACLCWHWGSHVTAPHPSRAEGSCLSPRGAGAVVGEVHLEDSPRHCLFGVRSGCVVTVCLFQVDDLSTDKDVSSAQVAGPGPKPEASTKPGTGAPDIYDNFVLPELPSVPDTLPTASAGANTSASEDIDFDDLSRRFEELKKKT
uniref:IST1 homolog n=1 Tax=Terrapene triunguis TaxID=2587831 RepID=A0A674K551_9SAUR